MSTIVRMITGFLVALLLQAHHAHGIPVQSLQRSGETTTHACSVFVQRWSDNSFDIYDYAFAPTPSASEPWNYVISAESIPLSNGEGLPPTTIGSNTLSITNVANPSADAPNTDPGKLSFSWGNQSWNSYDGTTACTTIPRGNGDGSAPTNTSCNFTCDA